MEVNGRLDELLEREKLTFAIWQTVKRITQPLGNAVGTEYIASRSGTARSNLGRLSPIAKVAKPWGSGGGRTLEVRSEPWAPSFFVRLGYD